MSYLRDRLLGLKQVWVGGAQLPLATPRVRSLNLASVPSGSGCVYNATTRNYDVTIAGTNTERNLTTNLLFSIVDCATGYGQNNGPITNYQRTSNTAWAPFGVGFGATQAGHYCTGARYFWGSAGHTLEIALWNLAGSKLASVAATSVIGVQVSTFATPVALTPGEAYCITTYDNSGTYNPPSQPFKPEYWYYGGAAISGGTYTLTDMSKFMPGVNSGYACPMWGPFICGQSYGGSGGVANVYGLGGGPPYTNTAPPATGGTLWAPVEPTVT